MNRIIMAAIFSISCMASGGTKIYVPPMKLMAEPNKTAFKFAPHPKPVQGTKELTCIGIKYQDLKRFVSASQCSTMVNQVSDFYSKNSRNLLKMNTKGFMVSVPFNGSNKNYNEAEKYVIAKHPGSDLYAVAGIFTNNHAGSNIAHLQGTQVNTATHEVGHLLGLGHAGSYDIKNGKMVLDPYGDHESVMSRYPSGTLTAPQYYSQGWLPEEEAVIYQEGQIYQLKRINDFTGTGISTVIVLSSMFKHNQPNDTLPDDDVVAVAGKAAPKTRDAFISFSTGCPSCIALHLSSGGGSQKIKTFANEYYDTYFTGLHIKLLDFADNKINISVDFDLPPVK